MKRSFLTWLTTPITGYVLGYAIGAIIRPEAHPAWLTLGAVVGIISAIAQPIIFLIALGVFAIIPKKERDPERHDSLRALTCWIISFIIIVVIAIIAGNKWK